MDEKNVNSPVNTDTELLEQSYRIANATESSAAVHYLKITHQCKWVYVSEIQKN